LSQFLTLSIERPVAGGRMLARHEGRVVFVSGAIPGERVRARVERVVKHTLWAETIEVIEPSPDRRSAPCDPACGGSLYAHVSYERQLRLKRDVIEDAFRRIGKLPLESPPDVAASPERGYRVRARLHVRDGRAGFFREGTHELCDARATGQLSDESYAAIDAALELVRDRLADCDAVVLAENVAATQRVLHLEARAGARFDDLDRPPALPAGVSGITTAVRNRSVTLAGNAAVVDTADELFGPAPPVTAAWSRHATSFFQANRFLVGALLRRVLELADGDTFVDLYAGVGLFAVALAASGKRGSAVEGDWSSAADLAANAMPLTDQLRVVRDSVEAAVSVVGDPRPSVVILDPPRSGVSAEALGAVLAWRAPRLVYVSCDPPTLARDTARIVAAGYSLASIEAFDLFPNTSHVEAVAMFTSKS
jgi:23S rRNA (uracil1939-C5)-methyltransferase